MISSNYNNYNNPGLVPPQRNQGVTPSLLGRRPPGTQTTDLGFMPNMKRSKGDGKNNDGGGDSDESDEDANLFNEEEP